MNDWPPTANTAAPEVDPKFVKRLTELGGTWNGKPKLRLVWGQSPQASVWYNGRYRLTYLANTDNVWRGWGVTTFAPGGKVKNFKLIDAPYSSPPAKAEGLIVEPIWEPVDIGIPRWFVEQLYHPNVATQDWDKERYEFNPETGLVDDLLGPAPSEGLYGEAFYMIADHDACEKIGAFGRCKPGCMGRYRAPASHDIAYVEWLLKQLEHENYQWGWDEVPPPEVVAEALTARKKQSERNRLNRMLSTEQLLNKEILASRKRRGSVAVPSMKGIE